MHAASGAIGIRRRSRGRWAGPALVAALAALAVTGCATNRPLMPTPNVYASGAKSPYGALDPVLETNEVDVLFVTDREPGFKETDGTPTYTFGRSNSAAFGRATVVLGEEETWSTLAEDANAGARTRAINLTLRGFEELGRGPGTPLLYDIVDGKPVTLPETQAAVESTIEGFNQEVKRRLTLTARKEVFIYVHGVGNSFEDAIFTTAELWHYLGREGVPIAYTWPAGARGLTGYTYDRESSEFTITHFKIFLKLLTAMPEVEKVHLIAHSRGTDVVSTSLRELVLETVNSGVDFRERFRIDNVVLAAPDIDLGIALQRTSSARVIAYIGSLTIYSSQRDRAIGVAQWLFGEDLRLGRLDAETAPPDLAMIFERIDNMAIVEYVGTKAGDYGHNYFRTNPAVSSDLVMAVRYDRAPGAANGRPLVFKGLIFWEIDDDYMAGADN